MQPKAPGANCDGCPAYRGRMLPPQMPTGKLRLAVVGEAPCNADLQNDGIFRSSGGRVLDHALQHQGLSRRNVYLTNAILCDCRLKDRKKAAKHCAPRLQAELAQLPADVPTVTFDGLATKHTLKWAKNTPIVKWRGSVAQIPETECQAGNRLVLPMIAPFEVLRTPRWRPVWEGDWERVTRILESGWQAPEDAPGRRLVIARDMSTLREALAMWKPGCDIAGDVETVGLGPTETALVCTGYSDTSTTIVVPWSRGRDGAESWWANPREPLAAINEAVCSRTLWTHNGPNFDHIVWQRYGFKWQKWEDTLLTTHALASHMPKTLAHVVTCAGIDVAPWKEFEDRTADLERLWSYNGRDVLYTALAARAQWERLLHAA